jgi:hypothetical protein
VPFDFDPLAFDFPALTLQCLRPPPTLYSSTQYPSPTSWSIEAPGVREFEALKSHFAEKLKTWKVECATATTAITEELKYPPSDDPPRDGKRELKKVEESCAMLETQIYDHLQSSYAVWEMLPTPRKDELWLLEMARSVGRRHKEVESLKEDRHAKMQRISHLESQIHELTRLQHPREFKTLGPRTVPMDARLVTSLMGQVLDGHRGVGYSVDSRHEDLQTVVSDVIERWKAVVVSQRANRNSMNGQRPLPETPTSAPTAEGAMQLDGHTDSQASVAPVESSRDGQSQGSPEQSDAMQQASSGSAGLAMQHQSQRSNIVGSTRTEASSGEDDAEGDADLANPMGAHVDVDVDADADADPDADGDADADGDDDADAEMADDVGYPMMHSSMAATTAAQQQLMQHQQQQHQQHQHQLQQQQEPLHVPRTRSHVQRPPDAPYMMRQTVSMPIPRGSIQISRQMSGLNSATTAMHGNASLTMHGNGNDSIYMG